MTHSYMISCCGLQVIWIWRRVLKYNILKSMHHWNSMVINIQYLFNHMEYLSISTSKNIHTCSTGIEHCTHTKLYCTPHTLHLNSLQQVWNINTHIVQLRLLRHVEEIIKWRVFIMRAVKVACYYCLCGK